MVTKPRRPCSKPGCRNLTRERFCEDHAHIAEQQRKERNRYYDRYKRDKRAAAFYKSVAWRRLREQALMRNHGLCQECLKTQKITPASMVHHKVPIKVDWSLRLRLDNLISLCDSCHSKIDHKSLK